MRLVLDTNVIVAALRSPSGASAALLARALDGEFTLLLSVPLVLEYESACAAPVHRIASGLSESDVGAVVSALCAVGEPVRAWFLWRPQLRDPADEMVLETAVTGSADALATFNQRDFADVPRAFGINVLSPREALRKIAHWRGEDSK